MYEKSLPEESAALHASAKKLSGWVECPLEAKDKKRFEQFQSGLFDWLMRVSKDDRVLTTDEKLALSSAVRLRTAVRILVEESNWESPTEDEHFYLQAMLVQECLFEYLALSRGCRWEG